jgi:hypothetical protein
MDPVQKRYVQLLTEVKKIFKGDFNDPSMNGKAALKNLPQIQMMAFDGDPLKFQLFTKVFDELVDAAPITDAAKLTRLLQHTSGAAYDAIEGCLLVPGGYSKARDILHKRYGDRHRITERLVSSLKNGAPIKTPEEIRHLADEIHSSMQILHEVGTISDMESQHFIVQVMKRLPDHLQHRWKKIAMKDKRQADRYPAVGRFAEFMEEEAVNANDPLYGSSSETAKFSKTTTDKSNQVAKTSDKSSCATKTSTDKTSCATKATTDETSCAINVRREQPSRECFLCKKPHLLMRCFKFKRQSPKERLEFVKSHNLCLLCFSPNHVTNECTRSYVCDANGCGAKHSRYVHIDVAASMAGNACHNASSFSAACIPVAAVAVDGVETLTVLDTG